MTGNDLNLPLLNSYVNIAIIGFKLYCKPRK